MDTTTSKAARRDVEDARDELTGLASGLIRIPTENPPSDTTAIARFAERYLSAIDAVEVRTHCRSAPVFNVFARVCGAHDGPSLAFNGHLDTYPVGDPGEWSEDPFSGHVAQGRIYGRGACDMKGGLASALLAFRVLAERRQHWAGELVMTLAGDEESMGLLGTQALLEDIPAARTDAMLCADVGSPQVVRVGEKGMIWLDLEATGKAAHGAHVHRGVSAIDRLREAMDCLASLRDLEVATPQEVADTIRGACEVSERLSGDGESRVLTTVSVNVGQIEGGLSPNLVASRALARIDIRVPMGVTTANLLARIEQALAPLDGVTMHLRRRYEPTWTSPGEPIVRATLDACRSVLATEPVANMRVGASDARLYRMSAVPTVVCGLTPHNLGAPDEYAELDEMVVLARIHVEAALRFLIPAPRSCSPR